MFTSHGLPRFISRFQISAVLLTMPVLLSHSDTIQSAEEEDTELPFGQTQRSEPEPYPTGPMSHADRPASEELLLLANRNPEQIIGKTAVLETGQHIGPVHNIQRSLEDGELYLILDATTFFNNPTDYAVPARDMKRLNDEIVIIAEYTGMHLRGLQYYEADYEDLDDRIPAGVEQESD